MNGGEWFYLESGQQKGPVPERELVSLLRTKLPRGTLVWRDGLSDWMKAEDLPELAAKLAPPPLPPPPRPAPRLLAPSGPAASPSRPASPTVRPAYRPVAPAPLLARPEDEPETLNPFALFARAFRFAGRFDRGEFAMAYFGHIVLLWGIIIVLAVLTGALGGQRPDAAAIVLGALVLLLMPVSFIISLGSMVRRLHDIGQSGWLALILFVPCFNLVFLVYLLATPGNPNASVPAGGGLSAVLIAAAALVGGVFVIGIVAAIAIPSFLRARVSANESAAIGDIRSVVSGQAAYQAMNGGYYESRLECLAEPGQCIPNSTAPRAVDASTLVSPKNGYLRELVTSPAVSDLPAGLSPTSTTSYAFVAHPERVGQTGVRSFCGDHTGRICSGPAGRSNLVETMGTEVACSTSCQDLQ